MVHYNSKYVGTDGTLDSAYSTEADGVAVLGFVFDVRGGKKVRTSITQKEII